MADTEVKQKHIALEAMKDAKSWIETKKEEFIADMKAQFAEGIRNILKDKNSKLDSILVASIAYVTNDNAEKIVAKLTDVRQKLKAQNIDNIILLATFYDLDTKYLFGNNKDVNDKKFPRRLDKVTKLVESTSSTESGSSTYTEVGFGLNWDNVNSWDWVNFIEPLNINYTGNQKITSLKAQLNTFAKICYAYDAIKSAAGSSSFDSLESDLAFPFWEDQLNQITYTSPFGPRDMFGNTFHYGVDLAAPEGTDIHCAADGVVNVVLTPDESNGGGNYAAIQHANGVYTLYMHMTDLIIKNGQKVSKGEVIGHVGSTGHSTGPHLHFQVNIGDISKNGAKDPASYFTRLGACPLGTILGKLND